jgi:hypothetical protein
VIEPSRENKEIDLSSERIGNRHNIELAELRQKTNFYKGVKFDSQSEVVCCKLLEIFVPKWRLNVGKTYNIHIGHGKYADFKIGNFIIEYHPTVLPREMTKQNYLRWRHALKGLPLKARQKLEKAMKKHCETEYAKKRRFSIAVHPHKRIHDCELIVCTSPEEFYQKVLIRFGENLPPKEEIIKIFPRH